MFFPRKGFKSEKTKSDILKSISMFAELEKPELKKVELIIHERTFEENEIIFYEGEPGVGMFIVKDGEVLLTKDKDGKEEKVDKIKTGEFFGELALLIETPRLTKAKAAAKTRLLGIFRPDLIDLINREPWLGVKILLNISKVLSERLYSVSKK